MIYHFFTFTDGLDGDGVSAPRCLAPRQPAPQHRPTMSTTSAPAIADATVRAVLLRFAAERARKTFCPSEVARALADDWRPLMPRIREVAAWLIADRKLRCTQRGRPCDPLATRGPIRFSQPPAP
jgi:hypothetical protein